MRLHMNKLMMKSWFLMIMLLLGQLTLDANAKSKLFDWTPGAPGAGRQVDLRASAVKEASKVLSLGKTSLFNHTTTLKNVFSLFPNN